MEQSKWIASSTFDQTNEASVNSPALERPMFTFLDMSLSDLIGILTMCLIQTPKSKFMLYPYYVALWGTFGGNFPRKVSVDPTEHHLTESRMHVDDGSDGSGS